MKTKNYLIYLRWLFRASQCSDVGFDRRFTVGSPSVQYASTNGARVAREWLKPVAVFLLLFTFAVGQMWGAIYSLTPNKSNTGRSETSYITTLTEFTYESGSSVKWKMNHWNPDNLQIKTNQSSASSEFRFYNNSAFAGKITKVVITLGTVGTISNTSGFKFIGGTSAQTGTSSGSAGTWNSTAKTITWTPGSSTNYTYFAFYQSGKVASGTNKLATSNSIVVTYLTAVTLNKNGGTANGAVKFDHNATAYATSSFTAVTRSDYTCTGYWTASSGGTKILNADGTFANSNITVSSVPYVSSSKWVYAPGTLTLYAQWEASSSSVSLTKAGETNGTFTMTQSSTAVTSVTTTSAAQAVTVTATPNAGYYLSNLTATNPTTGTASVTGSGNTRTVTYSKGANGASTITATFSPIWYLKGDFNEWGATDPLTDITSNVATVTKSLSKTTAYELKVYNAQDDKWYGNTGKIIDDVSGWDFELNIDNCTVFATVAGDYTFNFNISTKKMEVVYPDMTHPNDAYVYLTKWWDCYVHYWYTDGEGDHALVDWGYDTQLSRYEDICGTDYWCVPILDGYPKLIMKDNAGDPSNTTGDQTTASNAGKYITHNGVSWGWHDFTTYSITFAGNGNSGGSMTNVTGICPSGSTTLAANGYTKTGYTFSNWKTDKAVTANGSPVAANGSVPGGATLSSIGSNITLTAQWSANTISLTLDKNGGSADGSGSIKFDANSGTISTAPTRTGYTAEGYYTDAACTAANKVLTNTGAVVSSTVSGYTTSGTWTRETTPTKLYTKWTAKTTTISFNPNGGTGATSNKTATYDQAMPTPITCPTRDGYVFGGYFDGTTPSAKQYYTGSGTSARNWDKEDATCTLYARWYGDPIAWCDPNLDVSGDVYLTSYKDVYVQTTDGAGNLINISTSDLGGATDLEISYLDGSDNVVDKASSVFRLCDGSTYALIDASSSKIDVSGDDAIDEEYSIRYQPNAFGQLDNYKLQIKVLRNDNVLQTKTLELHGRALPQEFVIASKYNDEWYALPNTMGTSAETVTPLKITVNNTTTPTAASYAPSTAVYKGAARYRPGRNVNAIRFTSTGSNWLETGSDAKLQLSTTATPTEGVEDKQAFYLNSSTFGAYELAISGKKLGIYGGNMGMYATPTSPSGDIYFLPITNKFTPIEASAHEWGEHGVIVTPTTPSDLSDAASATMHIDGASPTAATTSAVNEAMGTAKNVKVDGGALTVGAIANDGKQLYIHWKNGGGTEIGVSQIEIPCVIAANGAMKTLIGDKDTWSKKEVHVLPGKTLTANAGSFGSSAVTIKELHIYPGATLDVTTGTLTATTMRLHNGWTRAGTKQYNVARVHIADNAALKKTTASIDYDIYELSDGQHYYPFAVPFATAVSAIDYADTYLAGFSTYGKHYGIDYYDGATRASGGNSADNWKRVASDATLQPGKGYTIVALPVKGEAIIRVPLTYNDGWTADGEKASYGGTTKNVVAVTGATGEAATSNQRNEGWYMLGVPFMSCYGAGADMYSGGGSATLITGSIVVDPSQEDPYSYGGKSVPYVSVPAHDFSEYIQTDITEADLRPGWSFFVQVKVSGNLTFAVSNQQTGDATPPYAPQRQVEEEPVIRTGIILSDGDKSDKTTLLISDMYSAAEYEINADLEKMFGEGYTLATYSLSGDTRLAYNALSTTDAKGVIPIGFRAPEDGEYTFSLNPRYAEAAVERVDLIDYLTGEVTDLMVREYTFTTERTQDDGRFALNVVLPAKMPTGVDGIVNADSEHARKIILDDKMFIIHYGLLYDATGKRVKKISK